MSWCGLAPFCLCSEEYAGEAKTAPLGRPLVRLSSAQLQILEHRCIEDKVRQGTALRHLGHDLEQRQEDMPYPKIAPALVCTSLAVPKVTPRERLLEQDTSQQVQVGASWLCAAAQEAARVSTCAWLVAGDSLHRAAGVSGAEIAA